jgi:hypothetical protein
VRTKTELIVILTPHVCRCQADVDRITAEESRRIDWILSDVARLHASSGMPGVLPAPQLPEMQAPAVPVAPANPAFTVPPGTSFIPPGATVTPPGSYVIPPSAQPGGPVGPPLVMPSVPVLPQPTPVPVPPGVIDPQQQQPAGPTLTPVMPATPAAQTQPAPQGKEAQVWKLTGSR